MMIDTYFYKKMSWRILKRSTENRNRRKNWTGIKNTFNTVGIFVEEKKSCALSEMSKFSQVMVLNMPGYITQ